MAKTLVLIGMPGTGKTTVGREISKKTGMEFIDIDDLIKSKCNMALKDFVAQNGTEAFIELQRNVISEINAENTVISTGGGVVLDNETMEHLRNVGDVVFLNTAFEVLESRLAPDRRLARKAGESFRDVFDERQPLYKKYSSYIVDCSGKDDNAVALEICELLKLKGEKLC